MSFSVTDLGAAHNSSGAGTLTIPAGGVPAGATLIVAVSAKTAAATIIAGMSDDAGNNYSSSVASVSPDNGAPTSVGCLVVFCISGALALTAGQKIYASTAGARAIAAFYVTGAGSLDAGSVATAFGLSSSASVTTGTLAGTGELVVAVVGVVAPGTTLTQPSGGWASPPDAASATADVVIAGGGYLVNSGAGALTYAPTLSGSTSWGAIIFALTVPTAIAVIADSGGACEFVSSVRGDRAAVAEMTLLVRGDRFNRLESTLNLLALSDGAAPLEIVAGRRADAGAAVEFSHGVRRDQAAPVTVTLSARADAGAPLQLAAGVRRDAAAAAEAVLRVASDLAAPAQLLANLRADSGDRLEYALQARADAVDQVEGLLGVLQAAWLALGLPSYTRSVRYRIEGYASRGHIRGVDAAMAAVHEPMAFFAGDTWEISARLHYADGRPFNLNAGAVIEWLIETPSGAVVETLTLAGGNIAVADVDKAACLVTVTPAVTADIAPGDYKDRLRATDPDGFVSTQAIGFIKVRA